MLLTQSTAIPSRDVSESFTQLHRNQSARQSIFPTSMTADPTKRAWNGIPARSACLINCPRSIAVGGGQTQFLFRGIREIDVMTDDGCIHKGRVLDLCPEDSPVTGEKQKKLIDCITINHL